MEYITEEGVYTRGIYYGHPEEYPSPLFIKGFPGGGGYILYISLVYREGVNKNPVICGHVHIPQTGGGGINTIYYFYNPGVSKLRTEAYTPTLGLLTR